MEQVLEEAVGDATRTEERIDIYELMLFRHSPAMFASFRRGEMANPFRPRPLPDRVKKLSLVYTVEDAVNRLEARIVQAPVNPGKGKPYGRDTQKTAEYLAGIGVPLEQALFEEDLRSIAEFKQAMLPKMGNAKLVPLELDEKTVNGRHIVGVPAVYRLEDCGDHAFDVILETTSNWSDGDNSRQLFGFNTRTQARALVQSATVQKDVPGVCVLLVEAVPPYRMNIVKFAEVSLRGMVDDCLRAAALAGRRRSLHDGDRDLWPSDLDERAHELWAL